MQHSAIEVLGRPHWQIFGAMEFDKFFRALHLVLPDDARLYFEGTSISQDIRQFYSASSLQPDIQVKKSTIFPKPSIFHLPFTQDIVDKLCELSMTHAEPEMFDHFKSYVGDTVLLAVYDFGGDVPILISDRILEVKIKAFSEAIDCEYRKIAA